jgi:hypothetical protein
MMTMAKISQGVPSISMESMLQALAQAAAKEIGARQDMVDVRKK